LSDELSGEVTLIHYFTVLKRNSLVMLTSCILFGGIATIYSIMAPNQYEIEVLLASADESSQSLLNSVAGQLGPLAGLALGQTTASDKSVEAVAILTSPSFIRAFIVDNEMLPRLFSDEWDESENSWHEVEPPSLDDAVDQWTSDIFDIRQDRDTGFWTLSVVWHDREDAARWAMMLVSAVNTHIREKDQGEAARAIKYLTDQLDQTNNMAIQQAIYALIETQMKTEMLTSVRNDYALRVLGPAVMPDEDHYEYPKRGFLIFLGIIAGLSAGAMVAFIRDYQLASRNMQN